MTRTTSTLEDPWVGYAADKLRRQLKSDGDDGESSPELPTDLIEIIGSLHDLNLAEGWAKVFGGTERCPSDLLTATKDGLLRKDYIPAQVSRLLVVLLAAYLKEYLSGALPLNPKFISLQKAVVSSILAGIMGKPDVGIVLWLIEHSTIGTTDEGRALQQNISDAINGDPTARRAIVADVLPLWNAAEEEGLLAEWGERPENLGFAYKFAEELRNDPGVLLFRGKIHYACGHSGEESLACRLAVEAAFLGSEDAWILLSEWSDRGDHERVLKSLLEIGRLRVSQRNQ